jgi:hypothetical protein
MQSKVVKSRVLHYYLEDFGFAINEQQVQLVGTRGIILTKKWLYTRILENALQNFGVIVFSSKP